ncbi:hypothetical protein LCGC14_1203760 [marine sediment metagenome]|uniref:Uncharacterized protein n=1 Tax=marine sediment metagenome TaxID=412755 RepID=A0A0F9PKX1_9ZZZZ
MTTRYQSKHYEGVAKLIQRTNGCSIRYTAGQFADLFAADNPPFCRTCNVAHTIFYASEGMHDYDGGFNRAEFLAACGLKEGR